MKTVLISLNKTFPPVCGAAVVTYNIVKFFSGKNCYGFCLSYKPFVLFR